MKKHNVVLLVVLFISFISKAQNAIKENSPFQKVIYFDSSLSKQKSISVFLKNQGLDSFTSFIDSKETSDESGLVHQRHQQFYKGLKVEFGTLITHIRNEKAVSINAELYKVSNSLNLIPALSPEQGLNYAINNIQATKYLWDDEQQSQIVGYQKPQGELLLFPIVKSGEVKLAYKYDIYALQPVSRQEVYVDAQNGQILYKNPIIKHVSNITEEGKNNTEVQKMDALITGNAYTRYSGIRSIETRFDTPLNMYVLNDLTRGSQIVTYNCERLVNTYQNVNFTDNDNNWTLAEHSNAFLDNAAQDAHWGAEMTYDFWKTVFNRNGFDDNNALIKSYVHYQQTNSSFSNAYWNGSFMTYGDGASKPYTTIDICGHEIGHAVCTYTANLAYQNQSGAMNESFSDIWGACVEHFGRTGSMLGTPVANVWRIGEDTTTGAGFRSMSTPLSFGDPDTFHGTNYFTTGDDGACIPTNGNDHCGVHTNSGVLNHWFYILTAGASGTNNAPIAERDTYNVTGIGIAKSSQIAFYTERDYLTPNSNYFDARVFSLLVVGNLYCASSPEVIAVTNAWFAVNIGTSFLSAANDISLNDIPSNNSINCGVTNVAQTIFFKNLGSNSITTVNISYNIDGGTTTNIVWNGNLSTCSTGSQIISLNTSALSVGVHRLNITITTSGDSVSYNNTKSTYIFVNQTASVNQLNTFESSSDNLLAYDEIVTNFSLWQRGTLNKVTLTSTVADNSNVYATNLNGVYAPNTKSYLTSRCYDLSQTPNPVLKFDMAFDLEYSADILYMQYSTNGGNSWSLLGSVSNNWYTSDSGCAICAGGEWTGDAGTTNGSGTTNGTKRLYSYDLSTFGSSSASPQSDMIFRFVFESDAQNEYDGAFIDNFVIEDTSLGNDQYSLSNITIYPNPVKGSLNYTLVNDVVLSSIKINDISGKEIYKSSNSVGNSIDVSNLSSGVYFVTFKSDSNSVTKKFIKE